MFTNSSGIVPENQIFPGYLLKKAGMKEPFQQAIFPSGTMGKNLRLELKDWFFYGLFHP